MKYRSMYNFFNYFIAGYSHFQSIFINNIQDNLYDLRDGSLLLYTNTFNIDGRYEGHKLKRKKKTRAF